MSTKARATGTQGKFERWCALAFVVNGSLLLAACGTEVPSGMLPQQMPGAGTAAVPPAAAGTAAPAAGTGTMGGAAGKAPGAGTGAAGKAPTTAGTGAPPATTAGTGTGTSGTGTAGTAAAGTGATAGTGGATTGGTGGMAGMPTPAAGTGGDVTPGGNESACLDGITNYDSAGPFKYEAKPMGSVKMWVPMLPAGCKAPIVHLNNGTGASCANYQNVLNRFASHGFISACYENANTGAGTMGVTAIDTAMKQFPDLYAKKIGSTGHSQGGQAAFATLALAEQKWGMDGFVYAGLSMEPASGFGTQPSGGWQNLYAKIKSPMFAFSGTADMLVPQAWVQQGYDALADSIEAYHWSAIGATHIPTPQPETMHVGVAWWRWKLLGDQKACAWFKALPMGGKWRVVKEQNVKPCM